MTIARITWARGWPVAVLFLACTAAVRSEDGNAPATGSPAGSWSLTIKDQRGKLYRGTLVISERQEAQVEGFIRWSDGRRGLEVVVGGHEAGSRSLSLRGLEWQGRGVGSPLGAYTAAVSDDGRELKEGQARLALGNVPIGSLTARWKDGESRLPAEVIQSLEALNGPDALFRNLSASYALAGVTVRRFPDVSALERLRHSDDVLVRGLAEARSKLESRRADFERRVDDALDKASVTRDLFNDVRNGRTMFDDEGAGQQAQLRILANAREAAESVGVERTIRVGLKRLLASRTQGEGLAEDHLKISYRLEGEDVMLGIENKTSRVLRRCVLVTGVEVDEQRFQNVKTRKDQGEALAYALMGLMDMGPGLMKSTHDLEEARADYERIGKGSIVYAPEWKPGARLEMDLSPASTVLIGSGAELTIATDDGPSTGIKLPLDRIEGIVRKALAPRVRGR